MPDPVPIDLLSSGTGLAASFAGDWVGEWNLGPLDRFEVARFTSLRPSPKRPSGGMPSLFVHNTDWFGVINGRSGISLSRLYHRWIHDYRAGRNW